MSFSSFFKIHGPKITNGITAAVGVMSSVDPSLLPPSWLPYVIAANALLNIMHNVQHNSADVSAGLPAGGVAKGS